MNPFVLLCCVQWRKEDQTIPSSTEESFSSEVSDLLTLSVWSVMFRACKYTLYE